MFQFSIRTVPVPTGRANTVRPYKSLFQSTPVPVSNRRGGRTPPLQTPIHTHRSATLQNRLSFWPQFPSTSLRELSGVCQLIYDSQPCFQPPPDYEHPLTRIRKVAERSRSDLTHDHEHPLNTHPKGRRDALSLSNLFISAKPNELVETA
jgi:hypothetical protein